MLIARLVKFNHDEKGAISIEFAAVFLFFSLFAYAIVDIYTSITLQNKLDRATYTVASLFRERSSLYPALDDTGNSVSSPNLSICKKDKASCFKTNEIMTENQVNEMRQLAEYLLGKNVAIKIESLFILQNTAYPSNIDKAKLISTSITSCDGEVCAPKVQHYLDSLPDMTNRHLDSTDFTKLVPFAERPINSPDFANLKGRWIPLYRVNMCITNDESLYLKVSNRTRKSSEILPNLCSEAVVVSRCNDLENPKKSCPIYITITQ